ncbi:MAG: hypothetical protein MR266_02175 [Erysipelotrichaceae bacterium]|nr:hypothetical protein [Erysipelotrichaceae bacterium]
MKKINKFLFIVVIFIFLLFISDFIFLLIEKKPLILTSYNGEKYSSIFYDVYICDDEMVLKSKFFKYSCKIKENDNLDNKNNIKENITDNNKPNNSNNNNTDSNNSKNDNDTDNKSDNNKDNKDNKNNKNNNIINDNQIIDTRIDDNIIGSNKRIIIIDKSSDNCPQAIEYYYEDNNYRYYFTCVISGSIFVKIDNQEYNIKYALNNKIVTMDELIEAGFKPLKKSKNTSAY